MKQFKSFLDFIQSNPVANHSSRVINNAGNKPRYKGSVLPSVMTFGLQTVNSQSALQTAVVTNTGIFALPIRSITSVGDWIVSNNCPAVLQPGASCQISAVFNPQRAGMQSGGIYVDTGDSAGTEFVQLMGVGQGSAVVPPTYPTLSISDGTILSLGSSIIAAYPSGTTSLTTYAFTGDVPVGNTATADLRLLSTGSVTYTTLPTVVGPFLIQYGEPGSPVTAPSTLSDGQSLRVGVTYTPTATGASSNILGIVSNSGTINITLTGNAVAGTVNAAPTITGVPTTPQEITVGVAAALADFVIADASGDTLTATLTTSNGTINGLTDANTSLAGIQLTGTAAAITASIAAATFTATAAGNASIGISVTDGVNAPVTAGYSFIAATAGSLARITVSGNQFIRNGQPFRIKAVNWAGFQSNTLCIHGLWRREWKSMMADLVGMGFNTIRLPFSREGFEQVRTPTDLGALGVGQGPGATDLNPDWMGKTNFELLTMFIDECTANNIYVILDHHSNNYDSLTGTPVDSYWTEPGWLALWGEMATRYGENTTIIGADLFNEPWATPWSTLRTLFQNCGNHIHTIAPDWLIFCGGGQDQTNSFWHGGNLEQVATLPVTLAIPNRVAYTPHEYGHSVSGQPWLATSGNTPANWPLNLNEKRRSVWSYIFEQGIAPIFVGEFGGKFGWNNDGTASGDGNAPYERVWLDNLIDHMNGDFEGDGFSNLTGNQVGMSYAYWSFNANSGDTGGLLIDNATWSPVFQEKLDLLDPLLNPVPMQAQTTAKALGYLTADGSILFDSDGGQRQIRATSWDGFQFSNMIFSGLWEGGRNFKSVIDQMASGVNVPIGDGINTLVIPISGDIFVTNATPPGSAVGATSNPELQGLTCLEVLDEIVDYAYSKKISVIFSYASRSASSGTDTPVDGTHTQAVWIANNVTLATRYVNNPGVIGINIFAAPANPLTWATWATMAEACANAIHAVAPNLITIVQGVGTNPDTTQHWPGAALKGVSTRPIAINQQNKLVYGTVEYGQSMATQPWLSTTTVPVANYPLNVHDVFSAQWSFIAQQDIAPVFVSQFGGLLGFDGNGPTASQVNSTLERQWLTELMKHMDGDIDGDGFNEIMGAKMSFCIRSWNPYDANMGGLLRDDFNTLQTAKIALFEPLFKPTILPLRTLGSRIVDTAGNEVILRGTNWSGLEVTGGHILGGLWNASYRTYMDQMKSIGMNTIRLPISGEMYLSPSLSPAVYFDTTLNPDLVGLTCAQIVDRIVDYCEEIGMRIFLDHHNGTSASSAEVGSGSMDGGPGTIYTIANWHSALTLMATRYLHRPHVCGIDIYNEPHRYLWMTPNGALNFGWQELAQNAGNVILAANPSMLVIVEGSNYDIASATSSHYGASLQGVASNPVVLNVANRLVYSPHEYSYGVNPQANFGWLDWPTNVIANWPENCFAEWNRRYGYIVKNNVAPVLVGEFGSYFGFDGTGAETGAAAYPEGTDNTVRDRQWLTAWQRFINGEMNGDGNVSWPKLSATYWTWNSNSDGTGGLIKDDFVSLQTGKIGLLNKFLNPYS